jgi:hypothetical protein
VLAIAAVLYVYRVVVQDKRKFQWRLPAPAVPEERPAVVSGD